MSGRNWPTPQLTSYPEKTGVYLFGEGGRSRPGGTAYLHLLCRLLALPDLGRARLASRLLIKRLQLPGTTTFVSGFRCIAGNLICGNRVALGDTFFVDYAPVYLGERVGFSFRNMVITSTHDPSNFNRVLCRPVIIERNVWITSNVTILPGVRIGENSIIGAGSVVTHDIPANVVACGNPCRPRKVREPLDREGADAFAALLPGVDAP